MTENVGVSCVVWPQTGSHTEEGFTAKPAALATIEDSAIVTVGKPAGILGIYFEDAGVALRGTFLINPGGPSGQLRDQRTQGRPQQVLEATND